MGLRELFAVMTDEEFAAAVDGVQKGNHWWPFVVEIRMMQYADFIDSKSQHNNDSGFEPLFMPDFLFPFQRDLVSWSVRKGRAAIFADCGLGKTPMQLVWSQNVVEKTNRPVLILTPLAVSHQTVAEAAKFDIGCKRSADGSINSDIVVTNYERLHYFNADNFAGVVCDESSIIKNFDGKIKAAITEFMRNVPYRLLCTATAAPNDYFELGTSSEALGYLGFSDMITRFFKQESAKDELGWGRTTYRFRGHAQQPFWQWVCSWARACRRPSDIGHSSDGFELPDLIECERMIENSTPRKGMLLPVPAKGLREQREERRCTLDERCNTAAELVCDHDGPSVVWCHLNDEGLLLSRTIPDALEVSGSMSDEIKEERLIAFQSGQLNRLITKPKIGCFGLNWQHCRNVVTFPSHSYEQYYQAIRRCWRFGQTKPVHVTVVTTEGEHDVLANLRRKAHQADDMFTSLVRHMNHAISLDGGWSFNTKQEVPMWL